MASQTTLRHGGIAASVASAATELSAHTRQVIAEKLSPYLRDGEIMPDAGLLQELLGRLLEAQAGELAAADISYSSEVRDHRLLRIRRLEAMEEARSRLRSFRNVMERIFGAQGCKLALGTRNFTSRDANVLSGLARQAAQTLREPSFHFDGTSELAFGQTSARMAELLEETANELRELAQEQLALKRIRRRVGLGKKEEQLAATKTAVSEAGALLKGLFLFTGNQHMARRLRPSHRKKGGGRADKEAPAPLNNSD